MKSAQILHPYGPNTKPSNCTPRPQITLNQAGSQFGYIQLGPYAPLPAKPIDHSNFHGPCFESGERNQIPKTHIVDLRKTKEETKATQPPSHKMLGFQTQVRELVEPINQKLKTNNPLSNHNLRWDLHQQESNRSNSSKTPFSSFLLSISPFFFSLFPKISRETLH